MGTPTKCCESNSHTKEYCIIDNITRVYSNPDLKDYSLYVTGHLLGGALAVLMSFVLAGSGELDNVSTPTTAITFAPPNVGCEVYFVGRYS